MTLVNSLCVGVVFITNTFEISLRHVAGVCSLDALQVQYLLSL